MRLGLIEGFGHEHIVYYLAEAATHAGHDVTVYTTEPVFERVADGLGWPDDVTVGVYEGFPRTLSAALGDPLDAAMVVTVTGDRDDYEALAAFSPAYPVLVWIQGVETWLGDQPVEIDGNDINVTVNEGWALAAGYRQAILRNSAGVIVESERWLEAAAERDPPVPVYHWPAVLAREDLPEPDLSGPLTVAVPGAIRARRDYSLLATAFTDLYEEGYRDAELRIPGRPIGRYGERILEWITSARERDWPVAFTGHHEYLPFDAYTAEIERADVILNPLVETINQRGFEERLGHTAGSGLLFDAIRHGTPIILPEYVPAPEVGGVIYYDDTRDGLKETIRKLAADNDLLAAKTAAARENATAYTVGPQSERLDTILEDVTT